MIKQERVSPQWINRQRKKQERPALIDPGVKSGRGNFVPSDLQDTVNVALQ